ncbi:MAG: putative ADP-ribosylglycohydrolase [Thermomicrobiales bacterium]|jgi:ADP-ribosyl-[dinitrogen reductase] hydrolase|nr:putative ADP-ribosylglycohydrolase [Thermomicrobiales bacterium]
MTEKTSISLRDRYAGTLLGLACGDALGGPLEFLHRDEIAARFPTGVSEFTGGGWLRLAPGEVTDDTQQALILAESLVENGLDLDRLAAGLIAWYRSNPKDVGTTTRIALEALAVGTAPLDAGAAALATRGERSAAANGAVMRCAPVALRFRRDPDRLVRASLDSARVTHAEARASWGTVAVNQAIVHLLDGGTLADAPAAAVAGIRNREVCEAVRGAAGRQRDEVRSGGFVLETIGASFWSLLNSRSAREAIETAVALGGDADSTGAVTGALAGAAYGVSALPTTWVETVQFRERLASEAMRLLALCEREPQAAD